MNTKTVRELINIAKELDLRGCCNPIWADLIALLSEQSTEEMPTAPARTQMYKKMLVHPVKMMSFLEAVVMATKL